MKPKYLVRLFLAIAGLAAFIGRADQIETTNGDHFTGKILAMTNETVLIQSEVLGQVAIPKSRIASLKLASASPLAVTPGVNTNRVVQTAPAQPAAVTDLSSAIKQLNSDPAAVKKVQEQYLSGTDEATKAKFNELLAGMQTGQIKVSDLRAQAQSAVQQLKSYQKELGPESTDALGSYVAILESFLRESDASPATNAPAAAK